MENMLDLSGAFVSRRSKFQHRRSCSSLNTFLFLIIVVIVVFNGMTEAFHSTECKELKTCVQCTSRANSTACHWSFVDQKCISGNESSLVTTAMAAVAAACPKFRSSGNTDKVTTVIVSDDEQSSQNFMQFLVNSSMITCQVNGVDYDGLAGAYDRPIFCTRRTEDDSPSSDGENDVSGFCTWPTVAYFEIVVDGLQPLVFDDARDHYLLLYPPSCEEECENTASCTACQWDDDRYRYYCTWCPERGKCGPYHTCDRRLLIDLSHADGDVDSVRLSDRCTRGVGPFSPTSGPWTGGTVLEIAVPDRWMLLWYKANNVTVTVAGRDCTDLHWSADNVTCTLSPAPPRFIGDAGAEPDTSGPVVFTVGGTPEVTVSSAENFKFVGGLEEPWIAAVEWSPLNATDSLPPPLGPTVDAGQTFYGHMSDGATFWVRGTGFSCLRVTRVRVTDSQGLRRYGDCVTPTPNDTHVECRMPAFDSENAVVTRNLTIGFEGQCAGRPVDFAGSLAPYRLHQNPVFVYFTLDGCCNVTVYGARLNVGPLSIRLADNSSECLVQSVRPDRIACRLLSPPPQRQLQLSRDRRWMPQIEVTVGAAPPVRVTGRVRFSRLRNYAVVSASAFKSDVVTVTVCGAFIVFLSVSLTVFVRIWNTLKTFDRSASHKHPPHMGMRALQQNLHRQCSGTVTAIPTTTSARPDATNIA